ncbi:MAG TPA: hypothetical protein VD905_06770 [Flavobacteriales bacterium]|nr:hypothetical protein [Flavobacteriales bacterium]
MDDIKDIIMLMNERDKNNFIRFLNVEKEKESRDDLEIFHELADPKNGEKKKFKQKNQKDAYHQNRKRLMEKLTDYYVLKSRKDDITGASKVSGLMTMCKFLFEGKMNRLGWKIARKAEKLAWETEQYGTLNSLYLMMIEYSESFHAIDIRTLIRKKSEAHKLAQLEENIIITTQIIKQKLHEVKTSGKSLNFSMFLDSMLRKAKLNNTVFENPKHIYNIIHVVRSSFLAIRNLKQFEDFILEQYITIEKKYGFKKQHHHLKIELLYMIAHVLYRNRKYNESMDYLRQMYAAMNEHGKSHYRAYYPKYVSLLGSIKCFTGKISEAIEAHERILFKDRQPISIKDELNMQLNIAVFYAFNKQFAKTQAIFRSQKHRDEWIENKMGREFVLRKNMVHALTMYDLRMEEEALEKLHQVKKQNMDLFALPQYEKVGVYIDMLIAYVKDPTEISARQFMANMSTSSEKFNLAQEENKTIAFFGWLMAKVKQTDYYKLVLGMVK